MYDLIIAGASIIDDQIVHDLLVSGRGVDVIDPPDRIILYWQSDGPIWNNDGDTATLRAPDGSTVDTFQYQGFKKR